jgi:hypothetical protein
MESMYFRGILSSEGSFSEHYNKHLTSRRLRMFQVEAEPVVVEVVVLVMGVGIGIVFLLDIEIVGVMKIITHITAVKIS